MPKLPSKNEIESAFLSFSKKEWLLFSVFALALVISTVMILQNINRYFLVSVPKDGGSMTVGIMPVHIWQGASLELNDANWNPVGSGPYRVKEAGKQPAGLIDFYKLTAFADFVLGEPHIQEITLRFYPNEEELLAQAINLAVDKEEIINEVLHGYGTVINDPIPPNAIVYPELEKEKNITREEKLKIAEDILAKAGWKLGKSGYLEKTITEKGKKMTTELQFSISTGNAPELAQAAELIRQDLAKIGMRVEIKTFEIGNLNQDIIRPRKYDSLLFGQIVGHESDLVAFWHSSQRLDPGLNVAMYANARVDKILEDAFVTVDEEKRIKKYVDFNQEIKKDMPAVFLYSPNLIYAASKDLGGFAIDRLTSPPDRVADIHSWFLRTEKVWKIFAQNQEAKS